jgi:hypothetical protein
VLRHKLNLFKNKLIAYPNGSLMNTDHVDPCYFYHNERDYQVTIAYKRVHITWDPVENASLGYRVIYYGASFCHPSDQFNKKIGRGIAKDRLNDGGSTVSVPFASKRYEVHEAILRNLSYVPWTPEHY